tara:strand:+ start:3874 stop:4917 length:1044 start_codon:yes stop_codon:yes gene_type:complete
MAASGGRSRKVMVSAAAKQAALGTYAAVDSLLRVTSEPGSLEYEIDTDAELIGGTEEMQDQEVSVRHYEMQVGQSRTKPHTLAFLAASALGSVSSATVAVGDWQHAITPKSARDFDAFTVEELLKSGLQKKYGDCFVDSLELSLERRNFWDISATILGSGKQDTGSASESEVSGEVSLHTRFTKAWLTAGTYDNAAPDQDMATDSLTGSPDVISTEIESLRWSYNNNTDQDFLWHFNSGLTWGRVERGDRTQTLSMTLLMERTDALDRVLGQTDLALEIRAKSGTTITTSYNYGAGIIWPKLRYTSVSPRGVAGGRMAYEIEANVLEHATYGSVLMWVWNAQTKYLA